MVEGKGCLGRVEPVTTTRPSTMNTQNLENVMTGFKTTGGDACGSHRPNPDGV